MFHPLSPRSSTHSKAFKYKASLFYGVALRIKQAHYLCVPVSVPVR